MTAVDARSLNVRYNHVVALNDVSITVPEGAIAGIIGPNGSGKSTAMKAMLGLVDATGSTSFFGHPLSEVRHRIGYMPQHANIDPNFPITVDHVVLMGTFGRLGWVRRPRPQHKAAALAAMEATGIADLGSRQIGELSGGQRQRVLLARMLAGQPDLFFMDEPFQGIDHTSQHAIMEVVRSLQSDGKTIVLVHHDLASVPELCDHVTLLRAGQQVASGPVSEVYTKDNISKAYGTSVVIM